MFADIKDKVSDEQLKRGFKFLLSIEESLEWNRKNQERLTELIEEILIHLNEACEQLVDAQDFHEELIKEKFNVLIRCAQVTVN